MYYEMYVRYFCIAGRKINCATYFEIGCSGSVKVCALFSSLSICIEGWV